MNFAHRTQLLLFTIWITTSIRPLVSEERAQSHIGSVPLSKGLKARMANSRASDRIPIIVVMKSQFRPESKTAFGFVTEEPSSRRESVISKLKQISAESSALVKSLQEPRTPSFTFEEVQTLWVVNAIFMRATPGIIRAISKRGDVDHVDIDEPQKVLATDVTWGLSKIGTDQAWNAYNVSGKGAVVAVIDTGANLTHSDLKSHLFSYQYNFISPGLSPLDDNGHGTHISGIIVGDGAGGLKTGVAPDAKLMILKAVDKDANADQRTVLSAIENAVANGANLINLSIGWRPSQHPDRKALRLGIDAAVAAGVSVVIAAGNEGDDPQTIRAPGDVPGAITVGSVNDSDQLARDSSRGPVSWTTLGYPESAVIKPDIVAPGVDIMSTSSSGHYESKNGTSEATAYVSGVVALMLDEAKRLNFNLDPMTIKTCLANSTVHLGFAALPNSDYGNGRVDAPAALKCVTKLH